MSEGENLVIVVTTTRSHSLIPSPKSIPQNAKQRMKFSGNILLASPYPTLKIRTSLLFPSEEITYTGENLKLNGDKLVYGPVSERIEPFSFKPFEVHFTHNGRFLATQKLLRTLEVSHWGNNLAYEEFYDVRFLAFNYSTLLFLLNALAS